MLGRRNFIKSRRLQLSRLGLLGSVVLLVSCWTNAPWALAEGKKTYSHQKYKFLLSFPAQYDMKVVGGQYFDFISNGKTRLTLMVDDQLVWFIHHLISGGQSLIISRPGDDALARLNKKSREDPDFFRKYARQRAQAWCDADGPDSSTYCKEIRREKFFTSKNGLSCLEFLLVMTRENYEAGTKETTTVGPVYAVQVPGTERPLVLLMYPPPGKLAPAAVSQDAREIIESIKVCH
jgi:hypothetical protein